MNSLFGAFKHLKNYLNSAEKDGITYKKKIMFYGYIQMNFGDDLFFETLFNRYPDVLFIAYGTHEYAEFYNRFKNVKFYCAETPQAAKINRIGAKFGRPDLFERLLLRTADGTVHIGGSIFQQSPNYLTDLKVRKMRIKKGAPFFSISNNFGPYVTDDYYSLWKKEFAKMQDVCFRDRKSYELFKGVKSVRYAPDVLFGFKPETETETEKDSVAISIINPYLNVRNLTSDTSHGYFLAIRNTVESLAREGKKVYLLGFCNFERDNDFCNKILVSLPDEAKKYLTVINYEFSNRDEMVKALSRAEYIIGTRLHSIILGFALGKKVLPLIYSDKIKAILNDIYFEGKTVPIEKWNNYSETGFSPLLSKAKSFNDSEYFAAAEEQFKALDEYLK